MEKNNLDMLEVLGKKAVTAKFKLQVLTEEEKNWVRIITNNGSIISNIEEQIYIQHKIGARLKGIKEL